MGLFNKKKEEADSKKVVKPEKVETKKVPLQQSVLRNSRDSLAGEEAAQKATAHAIAATIDKNKKEIVGLDKSKTVLEQAAIFFANGDDKKTIKTLIDHLNATKGQAEERAWYMLLDAYQITGQQEFFEKLAGFFSNRFDTSPPAWIPNAFAQDNSSNNTMGRNAISIDGSPSMIHYDKIKDFLAISKEAGNSRIDLSRMRISEEDDDILEGIEKIYTVLNKTRALKIPVQLMGDAHLIEKLYTLIVELEKEPEAEHQIIWSLLLEILQWRGEEEKFEDVAIRYAMAYEESPPSYSNKDVVMPDIVEHVEDKFLSDEGKIIPESVIDIRNVEKLNKQIEEILKSHNEVVIDFTNVIRMDYYASGSLAGFLGKAGVDKQKIVIEGATELVILLSEITGAAEFLTFIPRKK